jgi:hypothetical protein
MIEKKKKSLFKEKRERDTWDFIEIQRDSMGGAWISIEGDHNVENHN